MDDDPRHLVELGKGHFEKGQYAEAERALSKLGDKAKSFADVQNMFGVIYHEQGQYARAQRCFEQALSLNPAYTEAALNLSVIYNDAGRYEDARRIYEGARARLGENPGALDPFLQGKIANLYAEIGEVFAQSGQLEKAIEEYRRALALGPKFHDIRLKLAAALRDSGRREAALAELEALVREAPDFTPARVALGVTYYTAGQLGDAERTWRKALDQRPGDRVAEMYLSLLRPGSKPQFDPK
jgi:tetratricopeptide (TPR) repeat protein